MTTTLSFPSLAGWEATKKTLHLYSHIIGVVPRTHAEFHPKWWHISLKVQDDGLATDPVPLPDGGTFLLKMNLKSHTLDLIQDGEMIRTFSMRDGLSASALGDKVLAAVSELGLSGEYAREKFADEETRTYDPAQAEDYLTALLSVSQVFHTHRDTIEGEKGPVQLWPHGFDLAFEWFGTRLVESEEHGQVETFPAQLNLGFSPGEPSHPEPYFYSNPFPFEKETLLAQELPSGASWFTDGWEGSILPYDKLAGDPAAADKLLDYARAVFEISAPTLMA